VGGLREDPNLFFMKKKIPADIKIPKIITKDVIIQKPEPDSLPQILLSSGLL
jgi:hypothetical protein